MALYSTTSTKEVVITRNTKLRHLKLKSWSRVVEVLSVGNRWLEIASKIKRPNNESDFLYSATDISTLENQVKRGIAPAEAFLEHWSTTGMKQPTVGDLLNLLVDSNLLRAADSISRQLEVSNSPVENGTDNTLTIVGSTKCNGDVADKSHPRFSSAETSVIQEIHRIAPQHHNLPPPPKIIPSPAPPQAHALPFSDGKAFVKLDCHTSLHQAVMRSLVLNYRYRYLIDITGNFCDISVYQGGYKVGAGAFGDVYRACAQGQWVAIKRLKEAVGKQFINELEVLSQYKHENLLPLVGYSDDGPYCCLVYAFMLNGSLQERLACMGGSAPIPWKTRVAIACGTAKGINHLHTFGSKPLVHRDIKSANVLLDEKLIAKVGDFGLVRIGNTGTTSTVALTSNIFGTSVYMAREAFNGEVSIKLDTFSYGVVLLELLTGLPPFDSSREETDLISYVEENCGSSEDIVSLLDPRADNWNNECAVSLYEIAKRCIEIRKKDRPTIAEILPDLEMLLDNCQRQ